jgi:hypothetical protein
MMNIVDNVSFTPTIIGVQPRTTAPPRPAEGFVQGGSNTTGQLTTKSMSSGGDQPTVQLLNNPTSAPQPVPADPSIAPNGKPYMLQGEVSALKTNPDLIDQYFTLPDAQLTNHFSYVLLTAAGDIQAYRNRYFSPISQSLAQSKALTTPSSQRTYDANGQYIVGSSDGLESKTYIVKSDKTGLYTTLSDGSRNYVAYITPSGPAVPGPGTAAPSDPPAVVPPAVPVNDINNPVAPKLPEFPDIFSNKGFERGAISQSIVDHVHSIVCVLRAPDGTCIRWA